ncbi:MAG: SCP2 sterol-binding domain-containing protein [Candidatus Helarchaeota archaeon]
MVSFQEMKEIGEKWAKEYCEALNNSPEYEEAAKGWGIEFEGAMLFIMTKSGEIDFDIVSFLDLKDGKCLGIKLLNPGEEPPRKPGMVLKAPMLIWKKLAFKELNPVQALMAGELKLEGDMSLAMKYSQAAMMLADLTEKTDRTLFTKYNLEDE